MDKCAFFINRSDLLGSGAVVTDRTAAERRFMEVHTQYAGGYYAGYKSTTKNANQKRNWTKAL